MAELRWGAGTHPGQIRTQNEDNLYTDEGVFVVADGMGGHEAGEVASRIAVERIRESLEDEEHLTAELVIRSIGAANGDIFRAAIANPGQSGMGTTVTAIAVVEDPMAGRGAPNIDDNDPIETDAEGNPRTTPVTPRQLPEALVLANVGDSRTYLFRHDRLRRITTDHSYVQELVATGSITDDEARHHPRRNIITRALGIEPDVKVDWWTLPIIRGDRFVLCSDGLVDEVTDEEITDTLLELRDPQEAADRLIERANAAGGRDNVTVVVVDVLDGDDPPDPTQELDVVPTWADDTMPHELVDPDAEPATLAELGGGGNDEEDVDADTGARRSWRQRRRARRAAKRAATSDGVTTAGATATVDATTAAGLDGDDDVDAGPTAGADTTDASTDSGTPKKRRRLLRSVVGFVVLAAVITGAVALGAWARRGYFVDFDGDGDVTVFKGRRGGLLWIEPTVESRGPAGDDLSDESIELVDARPTFDARSDAERFVSSLDIADDADDAQDADEADAASNGDAEVDDPTTTTAARSNDDPTSDTEPTGSSPTTGA